MKISIYKILIANIIALFMSTGAYATHIIGGDVTYKCLGNDDYELSVKIRRDCAPNNLGFDPITYLACYDGNGILIEVFELPFQESMKIEEGANSECNGVSSDVCVEESVYSTEVNMPFHPDGYNFVYQRCCYNRTLVNVVDPLETGMTSFVHMSAFAMQECNNSPIFNDWAAIYICENEEHFFDHSATDIDGDSLVYEFCSPLHGASFGMPYPGSPRNPSPPSPPPYNDVIFQTGFDIQNMLGVNSEFTFNEATGMIKAVPDDLGQYLIGVCVKEYRDGRLISEVRRTFEYNVVECDPFPRAEFTADQTSDCGLDYLFTNTSTSSGSGNLTYEWDFDYPNGNWVSNDEHASFVYPAAGMYTVHLTATDGNCTDEFSIDLDVQDDSDGIFLSDLPLEIVACSGSEIFLYLDNDPSISRQIIPSSSIVIRGDSVFILNIDMDLTLSINSSRNGCEVMQALDIILIDEPDGIDPDSYNLCRGDEVQLNPNVNPNYNYLWEGPGIINPNDPSPVVSEGGTYNVTISLNNNSECSAIDEVIVQLIDNPEIVIDVDNTDVEICRSETATITLLNTEDIVWLDSDLTQIGLGNIIEINGSQGIDIVTAVVTNEEGCATELDIELFILDDLDGEISGVDFLCIAGQTELSFSSSNSNISSYNWSPDSAISGSNNESTIMANPTETTTYTLEATSEDGCISTFEHTITVGDLVIANSVAISCAESQLSVTPQGNGFTYSWTPQEIMDDAFSATPIATPTQAGQEVTVVVTDTSGCFNSATITVNLIDIDGNIDGVDLVCIGETTDLTFTSNESIASYLWSPESEISGDNSGATITVSPSQATTYTVMVATEDGCVGEFTHTVEVTNLNASIGADPNPFELGDVVELTASPQGVGFSYSWTPAEIMDDPNSPTPMATPTVDGQEITLTITDENGCVSTANITLNILMEDCNETNVLIPNMFSPDGDNFNDTYEIRSRLIDDFFITIYNRWGEEVYTSNSISNSWDGTCKGENVEPDVFGYYLEYTCVNGEKFTKKGNITLLR